MKKLIFSLLVFLFTHTIQAQTSFNHAFEAGIFVHQDAFATGVCYAPRLNFVEMGEWASISLGTHAGIGFDVLQANNVKSCINIQFPAVVEFNIGNCATPTNEDPIGFFIGGGIGYNYTNVQFDTHSKTANSIGPYASIGLRFSAFDNIDGVDLFNLSGSGLRAGFLYDITKNEQHTFAFTLFSTF